MNNVSEMVVSELINKLSKDKVPVWQLARNPQNVATKYGLGSATIVQHHGLSQNELDMGGEEEGLVVVHFLEQGYYIGIPVVADSYGEISYPTDTVVRCFRMKKLLQYMSKICYNV
jgi:hypothetical protein